MVMRGGMWERSVYRKEGVYVPDSIISKVFQKIFWGLSKAILELNIL